MGQTTYKSVINGLLFLVVISCGRADREPSGAPLGGSLLEHILKTEQHIARGRVASDKGLTWKVVPDSIRASSDFSLYSGSPGVVLFYLELYQVTGDTSFLTQATQGADHILALLPDSIPSYNEVGLYTGIAGMGYTLSEVYRVTRSPSHKEGVLTSVDLLQKMATPIDSTSEGRGVTWGGINEIVYGAAGIGLFLNYLYATYNLPRALELSKAAAEGLLAVAKDTLDGKRWSFSHEIDTYYDNFSHGTAGVAYFLSELYGITHDSVYLEAALDGAHFLNQMANKKGYIPHHTPGGEDLYYLSWCHGTPGTSRLYHSLYLNTQDQKWRERMVKATDHLLTENLATEKYPGFWNNVGKCCGTAGVAEHFLWMYELTRNENYLEQARLLTETILDKASEEGSILKWVHAENRTQPEVISAQSGLMQGSAGIGLWLLEWNAHLNGSKLSIHLPDKPR